jgi:hypothetical protein
MAGFVQIGLGLFRAGFVADYMPSRVIKGLLAAIRVLLILKQLPHAIGYDPAKNTGCWSTGQGRCVRQHLTSRRSARPPTRRDPVYWLQQPRIALLVALEHSMNVSLALPSWTRYCIRFVVRLSVPRRCCETLVRSMRRCGDGEPPRECIPTSCRRACERAAVVITLSACRASGPVRHKGIAAQCCFAGVLKKRNCRQPSVGPSAEQVCVFHWQ